MCVHRMKLHLDICSDDVLLKPGSQYDASLALRPLHCDKILKTDWSDTKQPTLE